MSHRKQKKLSKKLMEKISGKSAIQILVEKKPEILKDPYYREVFRHLCE